MGRRDPRRGALKRPHHPPLYSAVFGATPYLCIEQNVDPTAPRRRSQERRVRLVSFCAHVRRVPSSAARYRCRMRAD